MWEVVHDKGTFDAIALSAEAAADRPGTARRYAEAIAALLDPSDATDAFFIITSCNFTAAELDDLFDGVLEGFAEVDYPKVSFGGHTGQTQSTRLYRVAGCGS